LKLTHEKHPEIGETRKAKPSRLAFSGFTAGSRESVMKLDVLERISVIGLLPEKGSFTNLKLVRVARESLSFTEEESKLLDFQEEDGITRWQDGVVAEKDIKLGEIVTEIIKKSLKELDQKEELLPQQVELYEKFMI
jgi:ferric-dicitrate binding protein FerR (iron transport regulator)